MIADLAARGALFVANHSGGKDSQAMLIRLLAIVPARQVLVVHASLGAMEWGGALEHAQAQALAAGLPFIVARAEKTLLDMVRSRHATRPEVPSWPSKAYRQCTSDLKRGPIEREVRRYAKAHGFNLIVNCEGIRAQESNDRAKRDAFTPRTGTSDGLARAGRMAWDWLPIFELSTAQVFETIAAAGQQPHPAYAAGNQRLSCVFCIMASKNDLANGARHYPELFAEYVRLEQTTGYTMHMSRKPLAQLVAEAQENTAPLITTERGADGLPQTVIPGCEPATSPAPERKSVAQRRADAPLRPSVAQRAPDHGLFSDDAKQRDLF